MCMLVNLKYERIIHTHTLRQEEKPVDIWGLTACQTLWRAGWWRDCCFKTCKTRIPRRQPVCRQLRGTRSTSVWGTPLVLRQPVTGGYGCMDVVTHARASGTVGSQFLPEFPLRCSADGFSVSFLCRPAKGLHTSVLCLGGACCYTWKKKPVFQQPLKSHTHTHAHTPPSIKTQ